MAVEDLLDHADTTMTERVVIVRLNNARGQPLKHISLSAQQRYDRPVSIVVHRSRTIYCGRRADRGPEVDLLAHFAARRLRGKGHPYVAFADVPTGRIDEEVTALVAVIDGTPRIDEVD
jgi:hypothetical protein